MLEIDQNNRDQGRHGVVAVIVENSKFLVIRRSQWVKAPGLLCFPGGGIETGEDFETAMHRELMEEISIRVRVERHIWSSVTRWGTRLEWLKCTRTDENPPIPAPAEVSEILWLAAQELRNRTDLLGSIPDFLDALDRSEIRLSNT